MVLPSTEYRVPSTERRYYFSTDPDLQRIREQYVAYLERIFTLAGCAAPASDGRAVLALETRLARRW